jgi:hypothetical protein
MERSRQAQANKHDAEAIVFVLLHADSASVFADDAAAYLMENKFEGMMCLILSHTRGADTNAVLS